MKDLTAIETIVKYSKECFTMRFILNHLAQSYALLQNVPSKFILPSLKKVGDTIDELNMRIEEHEKDIGKLLTPILEGKNFGYENGKKYSLTLKEIREGYIILGGEEYVILLRALELNGITYSPGVLYQINGVIKRADLDNLVESNPEDVTNNLLKIIINKKSAYEYLRKIRNKED